MGLANLPVATIGAAAALMSSVTWAYGSARYAIASREVAPPRVNFVRIAITLPVFLLIGLVDRSLGHGLTLHAVAWLMFSALCSSAFADSLFFAAAQRIGVSSALAIASTYPLWAALKGVLFDHEVFGWARGLGTLCCVGGVVALIRLRTPASGSTRVDRWGVPLALITSVLWAGNTVGIKAGAVGLSLATVNSVRYAFSFVVLGVVMLSGRVPGPKRPAAGWTPMLPAVFADCVIGSMVFIYGLSHTDLAVGATLSSLAPLVSLPIALRLGAEQLSPAKLAAVATTVLGIVLLASS